MCNITYMHQVNAKMILNVCKAVTKRTFKCFKAIAAVLFRFFETDGGSLSLCETQTLPSLPIPFQSSRRILLHQSFHPLQRGEDTYQQFSFLSANHIVPCGTFAWPSDLVNLEKVRHWP